MEWRIQRQDQVKVAELARALSVSPVVAWALMNRGITEPTAAQDFLTPSLSQLVPKARMADLEQAIDRISRALEENETIGLHGDYDVDGITGTALLYRFLSELGGHVVYHLPHRQREGYGMKPSGVEALRQKGASLIMTVDCGVNDMPAILRAKELGLDVIVIDHHQVPERLPPALAILNPQRPDCPFGGSELSGVGAAFILALELRAFLRQKGKLKKEPNLRQYLDLVALGTIADVVPLTGWNRPLVHFGLLELNAGRRPGVLQLKRVAGILNQSLGVGQVAFQLAPRLNAAGRLNSPEPSLRLLLAENEREAGELAEELEKHNRTRKLVEDRILEEAISQIEKDSESGHAPALVVAGEGWHVGVIGIVASRLAETYYRPVAVIGTHEGVGKGSLRSIPGVNLYEALTRCADFLLQFGGHPMAAGITIKTEMIPSFRTAFGQAIQTQAPDQVFTPVLSVDAEWPIYLCDRKLVNDLAQLKPHGLGNPEPTFCARGVLVKWARPAKADTLLLGLSEKETTLPAVGFRMSDRLPTPGGRLDIVYTPIADDFVGNEAIKLKLKDFKEAE